MAEKIRCAIYTRKSTEEGLDQDFNSLQAQREAAEAYIQSQRHLGWTLVSQHYDDGGFTGGNLDRPALQRLLEDVDARRVQRHTRAGDWLRGKHWQRTCQRAAPSFRDHRTRAGKEMVGRQTN